MQNTPGTPRYCQVYKGSITARELYHQAHQDIYQAFPTMYAQNMYQVLLGSTRYRRVCAQDLISAHPNSRHPGLPSTQLEPTMKPMGAKYSGCIQAHFWFDDYLSTSEAEPKWSKSFFSPRHSTQHHQDIIIDRGGDQGCGENEGRDVGGQASSDWGCCLPTCYCTLLLLDIP